MINVAIGISWHHLFKIFIFFPRFSVRLKCINRCPFYILCEIVGWVAVNSNNQYNSLPFFHVHQHEEFPQLPWIVTNFHMWNPRWHPHNYSLVDPSLSPIAGLMYCDPFSVLFCLFVCLFVCFCYFILFSFVVCLFVLLVFLIKLFRY